MSDASEGTGTPQDEVLQAIGGTLLLIQSAERMVKFCMQLVFQKGCGVTYEGLKAQEAEEASKTLGYFLSQLRFRVEVDPVFDVTLREFLASRNQFAHNLASVPGFGLFTPGERATAAQWIGRLAWVAAEVQKTFMGVARAWQKAVGLPGDFPDNEYFEEIDSLYSPLVDKLFSAKPPK